AGDGLAAEGQEMGERDVLLLELVVEALTDRDGGDRRVAGGNTLRHRHEVGHDTELLGREHRAGAAETVDDLVQDQKNAMLVADLAYALPVARRRHMAAVRGRDRL